MMFWGGVERFFDGTQDAQSFAVLFFQEAAFSETYPMLTCAGSIHGEGPPDETVVEAVSRLQTAPILR